MYEAKRPLAQPVIFLLIVASIVLAACGAQVSNESWPGLSTADGVVYVAYGPGVMAVDVAERTRLWQFPDGENNTAQFYAPPFVAEEQIVIGDFGASGGFLSPGNVVTVYALDNNGRENGLPSVRWSRDDVAEDRIVAAPLQVNEQIFVGTGNNQVLALDAASGQLRWEFATEHSVWAQPAYGDEHVYVASLDKSVYALNAANGQVLWETALSGAVAGRPVLVDDLLYVSSFDRALHALDTGSGDEVWVAEAEDWVWGAPAVNDGVVFFGDIAGNIYAVDAESGAEIWTRQASGAVQTAPLYADGVLFVVSGEVAGDEEDREGEVLALNAESGEEIWRRQTPAPVFSTPARVDDNLVVAVQDEGILQLLVYDTENGDQVWNYTPPSDE